MSKTSKAKASPLSGSASNDNGQRMETSVRQLIANGKFRTALEDAKAFHKSNPTPASEGLLLDAYAARIQSLLDQNLAPEAKSLLDLVRERFPAARDRLAILEMSASVRGGDLTGFLRSLNDPELSSERRGAIEQAIQNQATDLAAIASCGSLPPEHILRQAAAALDRAFKAVTSGPVMEEQIALPEVSHRSPLAPWKLLIRAIACFYRGEDDACRECLGAIKPASVPSRLVPAMRAMLGVEPSAALKPAEAALVAETSLDLAELRNAMAGVDRAFANDEPEARIFKAVREAVRECQRSAPDQLADLKLRIGVRGDVDQLDPKRLAVALDGAVRQDASFFRMQARALECSGGLDDIPGACEAWDKFFRQAVRDGLFRANGLEAATLYLHMADELGKMPNEMLRYFQGGVPGNHGPSRKKPAPSEENYFLFPEKLYARACAIDPHTEAFSQWLRWAVRQSVAKAENVAREWHRIQTGDIEPLLYLMEQAEKRNAFPSALAYLEKAEGIDAVHSTVRAARLRLLAAAAIRHLRQRKPHLASEKVAAMAALSQSQQGDRPAVLAAFRNLICEQTGDKTGAAEARMEAERLLGGELAAGCLIFGIAAASKCLDCSLLPPVKELSQQQRMTIPASLAGAMAVSDDLGIKKFEFPVPYFAEAEAQFRGVSDALDMEQIRWLGELGIATEFPKLAWAASEAGLKRGGPSEAHFLLLRARALPAGNGERYMALAAAAAELGRFHRDMEVVDRAVEIVRNPTGGYSLALTLAQAREVLRSEMDSPAFPDALHRGPDYKDLVHKLLCQCPVCRRERGEGFGSFDEEPEEEEPVLSEAAMQRMFDERVPKGVPPDLAKTMFELLKTGFLAGLSPREILSELEDLDGGDGKKQKKGKRK